MDTDPTDEVGVTKPPKSMLEKHTQTFILLTLLGVLSWAGLELVNIGKSNAVMEERIAYQGEIITEIRAELRKWRNVYYTKDDAERAHDALSGEIRALDERVTALEQSR